MLVNVEIPTFYVLKTCKETCKDFISPVTCDSEVVK